MRGSKIRGNVSLMPKGFGQKGEEPQEETPKNTSAKRPGGPKKKSNAKEKATNAEPIDVDASTEAAVQTDPGHTEEKEAHGSQGMDLDSTLA